MKFVKKLTALFLAIVMTMAMGITAFAANAPYKDAEGTVNSYTLTLTNTQAGHIYKAYQLLVGDVAGLVETDESAEQATLSNVAKGTDAVTDKTATEIIEALQGKTGGELSTAANALIASGATGTTLTAGENNTAAASVAAGYYVIVDEYSSNLGDHVVYSRNAVQVVGPTSVAVKQTDVPELKKEITNTGATAAKDESKKTNTASIGDEIKFKVTGAVPNTEGYTKYYYIINDTMSKGFDLVGYSPATADPVAEASVDKSKFVVKIGDTTIDTDKYAVYVTENSDGTTSFKLAFTDFKKLVTKVDAAEGVEAYAGYAVGTAITVEYSAILNSDAEIGTTANTNTANLTYSNNPNKSDWGEKDDEPGIPEEPENPDDEGPTGETPNEVTKTYTTSLQLTKVDSETGKFDADALAGAEFTLYGENLNEVKFTSGTTYVVDRNGTFWKLKDGSFTTTDPTGDGVKTDDYADTTTKYSKTTVITTVASTGTGENKNVVGTVNPTTGIVTFTGLNAGKYTLKETKTPAGYNTITPVKFNIDATVSGSTATVGGDVTWTVTGGLDSTLEEGATAKIGAGEILADIRNSKGSILPSTGGMGTTVIYAAGIAMIIAAGVVVIIRKRMA